MNQERNNSSIPNSVKIYLDEISRIPLLNYEEEVALAREIGAGRCEIEEIEKGFEIPKERMAGAFKRYQEGRIKKGDLPSRLCALERKEIEGLAERIEKATQRVDEVRRRLIEANLKLVVSVAKKYIHFGVPFLDLIDEGNLGLLRAVDKFDYRLGHRFSTYAVWWIRQTILRALAGQGRIIRIPAHMVESLNRYLRAAGFLRQKLGREPTLQEVAQEMDFPLRKVVEMAGMAIRPVSLEAVVDAEKEGKLDDLIEDRGDSLSPEGVVFLETLREKIEELLLRLKDKERKTLKLRYGLGGSSPHTLEATGKILGISRERVRQIEESTLNKLRQIKLTRELHDFLAK